MDRYAGHNQCQPQSLVQPSPPHVRVDQNKARQTFNMSMQAEHTNLRDDEMQTPAARAHLTVFFGKI